MRYVDSVTKRPEMSKLVLVVLFSTAVVLAYFLIRDEMILMSSELYPKNYDHQKYISIYKGTTCNSPPWCSRRLVPYAARMLPFDMQTSFIMVSGGTLIATGVISYLILAELGFGPSSYLGPVLVYTFPTLITFGVYDFWLVDPFAAFLVGVSFYLIFIDRHQWLLVTLIVGMGVKESILLISPAYYLWNAESIIDTDQLKKTSLLLIVPAFAFLILRYIFTSGNNEYVSYYLSQTISQFAEWGLWTVAKKFTTWPFGLALLLWVVSLVDERFDEFAVLIPVVFLVSLQAILGGGIERYMMIAWPVATIFAILGLSTMSTSLNRLLPDELNLHPLFLAPPLLTILVLNINAPRRSGIPLERELLVFGCYLGILLFLIYVAQHFGSSDDVW